MNDQPIATPRCDADEADLQQRYGLNSFVRSSTGRTLERELHEEKLHLEESFEMNRELQSERDKLLTTIELLERGKYGRNDLSMQVLNLTTERDKLQNRLNELESPLHTCSDVCPRPMCVLRRERDKLQALVKYAYVEGVTAAAEPGNPDDKKHVLQWWWERSDTRKHLDALNHTKSPTQ